MKGYKMYWNIIDNSIKKSRIFKKKFNKNMEDFGRK